MKHRTLILLFLHLLSINSFSQTKVNFYDSLITFIDSRFTKPNKTIIVLQEQELDPLGIYGIDKNKFSNYFISNYALIFEFSDSTTISWHFVEGFSSENNEDTLLVSKPFTTYSPFNEIGNTDAFIDSVKRKIILESIIVYHAKTDTLFILDQILHDTKYKVSIHKNKEQVYEYNFKKSWLNKRNLPKAFIDYSDNLNYNYNLKTMQYKLFKWMEYYFLNRNEIYDY